MANDDQFNEQILEQTGWKLKRKLTSRILWTTIGCFVLLLLGARGHNSWIGFLVLLILIYEAHSSIDDIFEWERDRLNEILSLLSDIRHQTAQISEKKD